jgi:hypothetical protein
VFDVVLEATVTESDGYIRIEPERLGVVGNRTIVITLVVVRKAAVSEG